jgi:hypothetical protein
MNSRLVCAVLLAGTAGISIPLLAQSGPASGPVARYDMRAGTVSGFAGGMGGMSAASLILGGGGGGAQHELLLRIGSSNAAAGGAPKADHFMPAGARLGKSVALVTPRVEPAYEEWKGEKPKGRLLLYWGCGEHAPKGQPVVIDFAKVAAGQFPPGVWTTSIPVDFGPTSSNSKTYGHWPADDGKSAKSDSSLLGVHRIAGNYSPEIAFTLTKDFMAPLQVRTAPGASGSSVLTWGTIPDVTAYVATLIGGKQVNGQMGDMVMWTSSANRQFGGGLTDWLSPADAGRLVRDGTLMSPQTTTCTVPAEVTRDTPDFRVGTLAAFGPEEDFSYPPKPQTGPWNLEWTARIRHRSTTNWMEAQGMSMGTADSPQMGQQQAVQQGQQPQQQCQPKKRRGLGGLGGALGAAVEAATGSGSSSNSC